MKKACSLLQLVLLCQPSQHHEKRWVQRNLAALAFNKIVSLFILAVTDRALTQLNCQQLQCKKESRKAVNHMLDLQNLASMALSVTYGHLRLFMCVTALVLSGCEALRDYKQNDVSLLDIRDCGSGDGHNASCALTV